MSAVPVRVRLTLAFMAVMSVVLAATGVFIYARVRSDLDGSVEQSLRSRVAELAPIARESEDALEAAVRTSGTSPVAEVIGHLGRVRNRTPGLPRTALLGPAARTAVLAGHQFETDSRLAGLGVVRLLARRASGEDHELVVVAGQRLEQRERALAGLRHQLLIGGPVALLLSCIAGYLLTGGALRPVEALRRRAATISARDLDQRLPLIAANDELGRLQRTLDEMLARIHDSVRRERAFVTDASHELRSPIATMRTELELLAAEHREDDPRRAGIESAIEEADRLAALAQGLLTLARADEGELALTPAPTTPRALSDRAAQLARAEAKRRGTQITVTEQQTAEQLLADPELVLVALHNLVANAVRHAAGRVRLSSNAHAGMIELHVRDDGPGFPNDFLAHAWERFARGPVRSEGGSGLGLAIVRTIAHAHGGDTGLRNLADGGADVWMTLPAVQASST